MEWYHSRQEGATMNTKLFLQILLTLGCLALAIGVLEAVVDQSWMFAPAGWWRGAIACWMLVVAVRMVYPARTT
jgi:hypothetical protein